MRLQTVRQTLRKVKFSESPKRPEGSEKDSSDPDGNNQEAIQEQPTPLKRSVRVTVPPTRYDRDDDHVSFALVIETREPNSYREASRQMTTTNGLQPWNKRWSLWIKIKHENCSIFQMTSRQ